MGPLERHRGAMDGREPSPARPSGSWSLRRSASVVLAALFAMVVAACLVVSSALLSTVGAFSAADEQLQGEVTALADARLAIHAFDRSVRAATAPRAPSGAGTIRGALPLDAARIDRVLARLTAAPSPYPEVVAAVSRWERAVELLPGVLAAPSVAGVVPASSAVSLSVALDDATRLLDEANLQSIRRVDMALGDAEGAQRRAQGSVVVLALVVVVSAVVTRRLFVGAVLKPIDALVAGVAQLSAGHRPELRPQGFTELRTLARAFNTMSDDVTTSHDELLRLALTDDLTGLANRSVAVDRLDRALERQRRGEAGPVVLLIDLDGFKDVNDTAGHDEGDAVLVDVARRLRAVVRADDALIRLGGDEFVVVTSSGGIPSLADRLVSAFDEPFEVRGGVLVLTASVGVATAGDGPPVSASSLLRDADLAMYEAKRCGGAGWRAFVPHLHEVAVAAVALEADLRRALASPDEIVLHYQPIVELATGRAIGVEALVRWHHPERGLLNPVDFITGAESNGLIVPLGWKILRAATQELSAWRASSAVASDLTMSVNVAASQVAAADFVDQVELALAEADLAPRDLVIEITETAALDGAASTIEKLVALRARGVRIALDDFGTGYSSLAHLARLPFDILKIDKSFVDLMDGETVAGSLVKGILAIAHDVGVVTVAEGVECASQAARLESLGCRLAQGFHYARPLPGDQAALLLAGGSHLRRSVRACAGPTSAQLTRAPATPVGGHQLRASAS